jgi:very-short-patch-repair endonuclease
MRPERHAERHAAARYGVLSRGEAKGFGMTERMIERRVESGRWVIADVGVYRLAGVPDSWESRLMAAQLRLGPSSLVSHRSAGLLYGLDGVPKGVIELSTPTSRSSESYLVHRMHGPAPRSRTLREFRVTSVERTLLDLCSVLPPVKCGLAMDDALRKRITTLDRLQREAEAAGGKSGARIFRQLVALRDDHDGVVASQLETKLLRIIKRIKEYEFIPQFEVTDAGKRYFLDFAYPTQMVGVEGHSIRWHMGDEWLKADTKRDRHLSLLGWTVLYFCRDEVWFEPDLVEADIRAALERSVRESRQVR